MKDFSNILPLNNRYLLNGSCKIHGTIQCLYALNADKEWYSATDVSNLLGKSRQYYNKVMKQGKLQSRKTSAGYITGHEWIEHFIGKLIK